MSASPRTYDSVRFHRGTRGFAAFLTALNGFVALGTTLFIVPTLPIEPLIATWVVILGTTLGIAHFLAVGGLIRGRRWGASLVGYVATAGIAMAVFGALVSATGLSIFGADRGTSVGFFVWMVATWGVAARLAFKPFTFTPQAHRVMAPVARPVPDARPATGARKRAFVGPIAAAAYGRLRNLAARDPKRTAGYVIRPRRRQDVRPVTAGRTRGHHPDMDSVGMVIIAISALALLEVAAANLRGEERHRRVRRPTRFVR